MENNKIRILENLDIGIKRDELNYLNKNHHYIADRMILELVNGVNVVANDHNDILKNRQSIKNRIWDNVTGTSGKRQNLINESLINGLNACSYWLQDQSEHISRVDLKVAFIAEKLYETRESIIKFYSQFKDLDQQVEMISKTLESFKSETENKFFNIEKRLSKVEAKDLIREEILYLTTKENYEHFDSIYLKIYCLLDNLFSGTLGLIIEKSNENERNDIIRFLRASLKDATKDLVKKRYLDISLMINDIERVKEIDKNALSLISTQQYNTIIINNKLPEISDLVSIITTFDEPKKIIESQSNISEFITYDEFIEISINEQIIF
ncbi:hypothetical protein AN286_10205 (plasmid) [Aliarcobacter cryaerophilus ATCC 43158]|jgi:phenolic acid decarboxylase|uniref:Uncharacterized protein n=1 Tax=Aliarcobacter cryaerophilus ATCC 43158 TaxID=1032070 RepID=A0AAD0TWX0_9BACT|nr:diguanylate cyclase regulator RdcB family protein [Aliarcobacter cryaerophilus]AYJ81169.1 hypothetical protein ACRYA_a0042 [Aliarcobacter cryaerophilus ATCC 43158]MBP6714528.1 hypothetical protein [Aliarcobacter sp.]PRM92584.1 hypothetical protein CJ667_10450 [Aliarcobacter cryaerophilus]QCZ24830.1 hypothetical protein AN286_10205 [Aliarcobacter cryaerophilus ATCC 43158]